MTFLFFVHRYLNTHTFSRIHCTILYFSHLTVNYLGELNFSGRFELIGINQAGIDSQKCFGSKWHGGRGTLKLEVFDSHRGQHLIEELILHSSPEMRTLKNMLKFLFFLTETFLDNYFLKTNLNPIFLSFICDIIMFLIQKKVEFFEKFNINDHIAFVWILKSQYPKAWVWRLNISPSITSIGGNRSYASWHETN